MIFSSRLPLPVRACMYMFAFGAVSAALFANAPSVQAANTITSATYRDLSPTNGDGTVDTIRWVMDENVTGCTYEAGDWSVNTAGTINVTAITALTCTGSDANLNISITTTADITGGGTNPVISYANAGTAGSVMLTSGAMTAKSNQAATDAAAPQIATMAYSDDEDFDAKIDWFTLAFTETVTGASVLRKADLLITNAGDFTGMAWGSDATDWISGSVSSLRLYLLAGEPTAEDTRDDSGNLAMSTQASFSLVDSVGNTNSTLGSLASRGTTFVDAARPVLIDTTPNANTAGVVRVSDIVLTFSEAVNTSTDSIAVSPVAAITETWSAGNSVLTLDGVWVGGRNAVTITTANDTQGLTFAGAQAGDATVANPLVFYAASSSSATTETTTAVTYDIDVTSPNGGESYDAGDSINITWTSEGTAMSAVNINLMYENADGDTVQTTIVSGTTNDGSYTWTVPDVATDAARIQIVGTDLATSLATDTSDEDFSIGTMTDVVVGDTTGISPVTGEEEAVYEVAEGMYIRGMSFSTVYYIDQVNGSLVRRPFMDTQTYRTWQDNWDAVQMVTDATLPTISLGAPMLPKAGVVLVKIQSSPKVYMLEGENTLRWLADEDVAEEMYGADWADYVIDVPVTLFGRFAMGSSVTRVEYADAETMKTREEVNR